MNRTLPVHHLRLTRALSALLALAVSCGLAAAGCKKEEQVASSPKPAARESRVDPRLDPRLAQGGGEAAGEGEEAADAGLPANPQGANPHAGMAGMDSPHGFGGAGAGGRSPAKTADGRVVLGPVTAAVPKSWKEKPTTSGMRAAEWAIPGAADDAELVVYYFGASGAGSAQANLDRWIQQFVQPDGSSSADKARTEKKTVAGMPVTLMQVSGRYVAAVMPGATEKNDKPDYMLLGAIVETSSGPYYFKLVGPQKTVTGIEKQFRDFIGSMKPGGK